MKRFLAAIQFLTIIPLPGGVVVLTNALNQILEINAEDLIPGVQGVCGVASMLEMADRSRQTLFI